MTRARLYGLWTAGIVAACYTVGFGFYFLWQAVAS